jgi:ferredoxin
MKRLGLYFSGTGNSKLCLIEFMNHIHEQNIVSIEDSDVIIMIKEAGVMILAYPIYYSNLPLILKDFINNNHTLWKHKKVFLIATQGMFSGDGSGYCARLLKHHDASIIGGTHITMPDNIIDVKILKKTAIKEQQIIMEAKEKACNVAKLYLQGIPPKQGLSSLSHILGLFGQRIWFSKMVKTYKDHPKINRKQCIGCNKCIVVCPMHNLYLDTNNKAIHTTSCTLCYRCIHTCPTKSIALLGKQVVHEPAKK